MAHHHRILQKFQQNLVGVTTRDFPKLFTIAHLQLYMYSVIYTCTNNRIAENSVRVLIHVFGELVNSVKITKLKNSSTQVNACMLMVLSIQITQFNFTTTNREPLGVYMYMYNNTTCTCIYMHANCTCTCYMQFKRVVFHFQLQDEAITIP